jgi:hypothetical protein
LRHAQQHTFYQGRLRCRNYLFKAKPTRHCFYFGNGASHPEPETEVVPSEIKAKNQILLSVMVLYIPYTVLEPMLSFQIRLNKTVEKQNVVSFV